MPTPAERRALLFLAAVALLGAGVRAVRGARGDDPAAAAMASREALARQIAAVDSARRARSLGRGRRRARASRDDVPPARPIDLDTAGPATIETLPGIGPSLAARIVADRDSFGPFGSLDEFQRVKGVGPRLAERLRFSVTFSQTPRPQNAVIGGRRAPERDGTPSGRRVVRP